jgi:hypothetical protein
MKQCPTCQSQYTDDTLQFCLQDGSPLRFVAGAPPANTLAYGEQETVVAGRQSEKINTPHITNPTDWNPNQFPSNAALQPAERKSNPTVAVLLTAFVMLLLFSFVGIGAWLYFRGATPDDDGNLFIAKKRPDSQTANRTTTLPVDSSKPTPLATALPESSDTTAATNTNSAPVDKEQVKRDVALKVNSWKSAAESRNLDSYMRNYAGTVDYYNKKGASIGSVRADKQRAFTAYDSMKITLSNLSVVPDAAGETATAVFDKEWVFQGAKYSAGKVQTQLKLKKTGGEWLITGERDLKVYYTE